MSATDEAEKCSLCGRWVLYRVYCSKCSIAAAMYGRTQAALLWRWKILTEE